MSIQLVSIKISFILFSQKFSRQNRISLSCVFFAGNHSHNPYAATGFIPYQSPAIFFTIHRRHIPIFSVFNPLKYMMYAFIPAGADNPVFHFFRILSIASFLCIFNKKIRKKEKDENSARTKLVRLFGGMQ